MSGWGFTDRPAVTVGNAVGRGLIGGSGAKDAVLAAIAAGSFLPSIHAEGDDYAEQTRITVEEAATLQTYPTHLHRAEPIGLKAVDVFAGTGWGVACAALGIEEHGVEIMPEARAVREANGMRNLFADAWDTLTNLTLAEDDPRLIAALAIMSPPCQTFSMAGKGSGRQALDAVLKLIDERAYLDIAALKAFGEAHDPRTALVLIPLAYVAKYTPTYLVLEQVPPVLPVWERMAVELRRWGYSVAVDVLNAEQYGVPQTRKRAILIARNDGVEATMPTPTHSRYYSRTPERLDEGVLPWVSMAEALGWTDSAGEQRRHRGAGMLERHGERPGRSTDEPALTVVGNASGTTPGGFAVMRSNYGTGGDPGDRGERTIDEPAATVTSKADRNQWRGHQKPGGTDYQRRDADAPAPTVTGGSRSAQWVSRPGSEHHDPRKPATTVAGDPRLSSRDHHEPGAQNGRALRVTLEEAAALQSYPEAFKWWVDFDDPKTGKRRPITKTNLFLQVGNAVPPLLAHAILKHIIDTRKD